MNIKKGDTVIIRSGKDRGKKGKVLRVVTKSGKVLVEGINIIKKHQRQTQKFQGGIVERPAALVFCKVTIICPRCNKAGKIKRVEGTRVCKKCGEAIDKE